MKKLLAFGLAATLSVAGMGVLAGCSEGSDDSDEGSITVGLIALHDSNSTYDKNFIDAMREACDNKGVELVIRTGIPENQTCYDTASDLVDQGCDVIFADSFGHEDFVLQAARENPDVQFCHATGTKAHTEGVANFHNAFASIYEGRYLAGVAAGMKLVEMYEAGELEANNYEDGNIKINGEETTVYTHPTTTAVGAGFKKVGNDDKGHVVLGADVTKQDIVALGIPAQDTTYSDVVAGGASGLMSGADKTKLDGIEVATDPEVKSMLDEVFGASDEETT